MQKYKRNIKIVALLKQGYSYRRIAKKFRMSYQNVCNIKSKVFGKEKLYKKHEIELQYHPLGYTPNERGIFILVAYLLRIAIKDFYHNKLSAKDLDKVGGYFDLKRLSKIAKCNKNNGYSLHTTKV